MATTWAYLIFSLGTFGENQSWTRLVITLERGHVTSEFRWVTASWTTAVEKPLFSKFFTSFDTALEKFKITFLARKLLSLDALDYQFWRPMKYYIFGAKIVTFDFEFCCENCYDYIFGAKIVTFRLSIWRDCYDCIIVFLARKLLLWIMNLDVIFMIAFLARKLLVLEYQFYHDK